MMATEKISPVSGSRRTSPPSASRLGTRKKLHLPVVLYLMMIALPIEFDIGPIFMTGVRAVLIVTLLPILVGLVSGRFGRVIWSDVLLLVYSIWIIITLFINSPDQAVSFGGSVAVELFGGYLLARAYVRTADDFAMVCRAIFTVVIFTIPFGMYESFTGLAPIPVLLDKLPYFYSVTDFYNELAGIRFGFERAQVIFPHPILYGLFCSTAVSLAFVGFKGVFSNPARYFISFLMIFGTILSISSGAVLPLVMQIGFNIWAWALGAVKRKWIFLLLLTALAYVVVDLISNRTPITVFLSYATFSEENAYGRIDIFNWGMKNVWDKPLLGRGLNDWFRAWYMHSPSMDNFWLLGTVRYGIPGFVLIALSFVLLIWQVMWRDFEGDRVLWNFRRAWVFTMVGLVFTLCTVDVWATAQSYVFFLLGTGVWLVSAQSRAADTDDDALVHPEQSSTRRFTRFPPVMTRK